MQKRRGISPVIATVIIVAVTIAVAIAVAFWSARALKTLEQARQQSMIYSLMEDRAANGV